MKMLKTRLEIILRNSERVLEEVITSRKEVQKKLEGEINNFEGYAPIIGVQLRDNAEKINQYITIKEDVRIMLDYLTGVKEVYEDGR